MLVFVVAVVVLLLALAVVSYPLLFQVTEPYHLPLPPAEFSERDALLDAIDELEHAFLSGKLTPVDYEAQRAKLEMQYVAVAEAAEAQDAARAGRR